MNTYQGKEIIKVRTNGASCDGCIGATEKAACKQLPICTTKWDMRRHNPTPEQEVAGERGDFLLPGNAHVWQYAPERINVYPEGSNAYL